MSRYDDIKHLSRFIGRSRKRNDSGKTGTVERRGKGLNKKKPQRQR